MNENTLLFMLKAFDSKLKEFMSPADLRAFSAQVAQMYGMDGWCKGGGDLISRAAVIEAVHDEFDGCLVWDESGKATANEVERIIASLPSAQPDEEKVSNILYNIYRNTSPHTSADGVAAIKYYIAEIWREIFGEEGPRWLKK